MKSLPKFFWPVVVVFSLCAGLALWAAGVETYIVPSPATVQIGTTNIAGDTGLDLTTALPDSRLTAHLSATFTAGTGATNALTTGTNMVSMVFGNIADGTNYDTPQSANVVLTAPANGTTRVTVGRNFDFTGWRKLKLLTVTNSQGDMNTNGVALVSNLVIRLNTVRNR